MKKISKFLLLITIPVTLILYSYSSGSPGGKSGSPGDGGANCTQCHSGSPHSAMGWITSDIPLEGYSAGQSYIITLTGTHTGVVKYGFELTAEDTIGNKFGTLSILESSRTHFTNGNTAVTHSLGGTTPQGNSITWTMQWTAPISGGGPVKFYASVNAANGNGNTSGDVIYLTNRTYNEHIPSPPAITSVMPNIAQQGWIIQVEITGENTNWSGTPVVAFKYHNNNNIVVMADSVNVQSTDSILAYFAIPIDAKVGIYDVFVDDLVLENGFTIDVYDLLEEGLVTIDNIRVYPVPAVSVLHVDAPVNSIIRIVDIQGKIMLEDYQTREKTTFSLSKFPKGIYFISVQYGNKSKSVKIIKR